MQATSHAPKIHPRQRGPRSQQDTNLFCLLVAGGVPGGTELGDRALLVPPLRPCVGPRPRGVNPTRPTGVLRLTGDRHEGHTLADPGPSGQRPRMGAPARLQPSPALVATAVLVSSMAARGSRWDWVHAAVVAQETRISWTLAFRMCSGLRSSWHTYPVNHCWILALVWGVKEWEVGR